jgi:hypothetical protein
MALTEQVRLKLEGKGFDGLYTAHEDAWKALANSARDLLVPRVASGQPTVDDIKAVLEPLVELEPSFRAFMKANPKLTEKYWPREFTDYLLHRVYQPTLTVEEKKQEAKGENDDEG